MDDLVRIPKLHVEVDGAPLGDDEARTLTALRVQQALSLPSLCEMTFDMPSGQLADAQGLLPGKRLRVKVEMNSPSLFEGEITAIEHCYGPSSRQQVRIRAYDLLHRLRKSQPVRSLVDQSVANLARELVADLNISIDAASPGALARRLVQWHQSDLELLTRTARQSGLYCFLDADTLRLVTLAGWGDQVRLVQGRNLLETRIDVNVDPACRSVSVMGWDPWLSEPHQGSATSPRSGRRIEMEVTPAQVHVSGKRMLVDRALQSDDIAVAQAQSELDQRVAGEVTLWGIAHGDVRLQPGRRIHVSGVAARLSGQYVLTRVDHQIDRERGYTAEMHTEPPASLKDTSVTTSTLGSVTDVDDPSALGRVRVSLVNFGGLESDWLEVVLPGAGKSKGLIALPDIGDKVLVLLVGGDPAQGIVLGGLYGKKGPPDGGVQDGSIQRYSFITPGGQRVVLDDEKETVRIENDSDCSVEISPEHLRLADGHGSRIELAENRVSIHAATNLEIEAPGKSVTIRGAAIDFETG